MASSASATFDFQDVLKALKNLPINIEKNIMVGATRAGANVVKDESQRLVPKKTGTLRKSIGVTKRNSKNRNEIQFSISPRIGGKNSGFYGRFIELGTSKMNAKPFLRPAIENTVDEVLQASKKYIDERLPQEVMKARK